MIHPRHLWTAPPPLDYLSRRAGIRASSFGLSALDVRRSAFDVGRSYFLSYLRLLCCLLLNAAFRS